MLAALAGLVQDSQPACRRLHVASLARVEARKETIQIAIQLLFFAVLTLPRYVGCTIGACVRH